MSGDRISTPTSRAHAGGAGGVAYGSITPSPNSCTHVGWTDERTEKLRTLWASGMSCSQIATKLGGITRDAVIGKVHRLGLSGRASAAVPRRVAHVTARRPQAPKKPKPALKVIGDRQVFTASEAQPPRVALNARAFAPLDGQAPVPFGSGGCRWPVALDGADMQCCGAERRVADGKERPYCEAHCAVAYQPLPKARAERPAFHNSGRKKAWAA